MINFSFIRTSNYLSTQFTNCWINMVIFVLSNDVFNGPSARIRYFINFFSRPNAINV